MKNKLEIFSLVFITFWLRLVNLGYSDYQGDEIKALFLPEIGESLYHFLLDQRKGPVQFIITFLIKLLHPSYKNEFIVRLPFALAGAFTVIVFFKLLEAHFGRKKAFYASFFLATNGFFIAFSRIVQYQSFVIFFDILALYFLTLAIKNKKWVLKGIYFGLISWALSILSHYDGVFIAPFAFYLIFMWFKENRKISLNQKVKHFLIAGFISVVLLTSFYIPFLFSISEKTKDYWQNRLSGGAGKISSSRYLFSVYHPIYVIHIYTILFGLGFLSLLKRVKEFKIISLIAWVLIPLTFLEVIVNIPGTHIFTYLLPFTVLLAFGIAQIEKIISKTLGKYSKLLIIAGLSIAFTFIFLQSHAVFVDHKKEYPWENEKFLIWEFHKPTPVFHLSMFGFPYYRHWEEIGEFVTTTENNGYYSTNERKSIARYFVPFGKSTDDAGHFIYVYNPQSFASDIVQKKAIYWTQKYEPVKTLYKSEKPIVDIYFMKPGELETIMNLGY